MDKTEKLALARKKVSLNTRAFKHVSYGGFSLAQEISS